MRKNYWGKVTLLRGVLTPPYFLV